MAQGEEMAEPSREPKLRRLPKISPKMSSSLRQIQKKRDSLQELAEKYRLPKITVDAKVDTNRSGQTTHFAGLKPGELEQELVRRVTQADYVWVGNCLSKAKEVLFSPWGGHITQTCILYAANRGDVEMCKLLLRYGGRDLLTYKDVKNRDAAWYARKHGIDVGALKGMASLKGLVDCWNFKVLQKKNSDNLLSGGKHLGAHRNSHTELESCSTAAGSTGASSLNSTTTLGSTSRTGLSSLNSTHDLS